MTAAMLRYQCKVCGHKLPSWTGQCAKCQHWDSYASCPPSKGPVDPANGVVSSTDLVKGHAVQRVASGVKYLDRVMMGGFVKGRAVGLAGGEGGGKSTLLLQAGGRMANDGRRVLYVCGEETVGAVQARAKRLSAAHPELLLTAAVEIQSIKNVVTEHNPRVVLVDSVQSIYDATLRGEPGDTAQVKRCIKSLAQWCNDRNLISVFLMQLNARNEVSGPRFLRHMVDAVLMLKKDDKTGLRELKVRKNRDGADDQVARLRMTGKGLEQA